QTPSRMSCSRRWRDGTNWIQLKIHDLSLRRLHAVRVEDPVRGRDDHVLVGPAVRPDGPNGAGKSTFMKLLTGESDPQRGTVARPQKIGVLRQDQYAFDSYRVLDTVIMGNHRLWSA